MEESKSTSWNYSEANYVDQGGYFGVNIHFHSDVLFESIDFYFKESLPLAQMQDFIADEDRTREEEKKGEKGKKEKRVVFEDFEHDLSVYEWTFFPKNKEMVIIKQTQIFNLSSRNIIVPFSVVKRIFQKLINTWPDFLENF